MRDPNAGSELLACSRCDGPVGQEELADGLAVRVDGQAVCQLCIETLPPAVRVQINRVRALKGLAVTTYRMAFPGRPQHALFTFTSAGLLMLHRRALVHGTEFPTSELPAHGAVASGPVIVEAAPPRGRAKLPLLIAGGASVALLIGVSVLVAANGPRQAAPPLPPPTAAAEIAPVTPKADTSAPNEPVQAQPMVRKSFSDYLNRQDDAFVALATAEADGADAGVRDQLTSWAHRERDAQLRSAFAFLQGGQLDKAQQKLDAMRIPAGRGDFADQLGSETALRRQIEQRRKALVQATTTPAAAPPAPTPAPAPQVSATPAMQPEPAVRPAEEPAQPKPEAPAASISKPEPVVRAHTAIWTGPIGPAPAAFVEPDGKSRIPSPWPFFPSTAPPRFAAAVQIRDADRRDRFVLQIAVAGNAVAKGGICLVLHPNKLLRKELVITRLDDPSLPETRVAFPRAGWLPVGVPVADSAPQPVFQIADGSYTGGDPFWLGSVVTVAGGEALPDRQSLTTPGLLTPDPIIELKPSLIPLLQAVAENRGNKAKWADPKLMPIEEGVQILACSRGSANEDTTVKRTVYKLLHERVGIRNVDNLLENEDVTDPERMRAFLARTARPRLDPTRTVVLLVPEGREAALDANEWAKRVRAISAAVSDGADGKSRSGWLPVWVIGRLDGKPVDSAPWSRVRENSRIPLIDLTVGDPPETLGQLGESLSMLIQQLRWLQLNHGGK